MDNVELIVGLCIATLGVFLLASTAWGDQRLSEQLLASTYSTILILLGIWFIAGSPDNDPYREI